MMAPRTLRATLTRGLSKAGARALSVAGTGSLLAAALASAVLISCTSCEPTGQPRAVRVTLENGVAAELVAGSYPVVNGKPSYESGASVGRCWITEKDKAGARWTAQGSSSPNVRVWFRDGQWGGTDLGPPFKARLFTGGRAPYRSGQQIVFGATVTGVDGKEYQFTRNGQRQRAPGMVIRDESGKQLRSLTFQYG